MLYYATSNNLCLCTTWQNRETRKFIFHSNAVLMHKLLLDFFNIFDSQLILTLLYDSLKAKSCNQCIHLRLLGCIVQEKGS